MRSNIICLVGCDGSGKSTLAKFMVDELRRRGLRPVLVWSRFNNILSKPLLALARLLAHSPKETHEDVTFGYHDFEKVFWLRWPFAVLQAIDVNMAVRCALRRARRQGDIVVFERSPWDTLADVILDTGCASLATNRLGRWMVSGVSGPACSVLWIDRSKKFILTTRKELRYDRKLDSKLGIYAMMAKEYQWVRIDNNSTLEKVCQCLTAWIKEREH